MAHDRFHISKIFIEWLRLTAAAGMLLATAPFSLGQSSDQYLPTPVFQSEINGSIPALDLGDSRLTRHYYAFEATPGDLIVTVNSRNLNGDVDIFTAVTFRPLMKISIYANTIPPEVTKSLYFRARQILILRMEARTPNDDPGVYRITFGGSFQPFTGGIPVAENVEAPSAQAAGERGANRLSSVGATLPRPPEEAKPKERKPAETISETPTEEAAAKKSAPKPKTTRNTPRSTARSRPARTPRSKPATTEKAKTEEPGTESATNETAKTKTGKRKTARPKTEETKPAAAEGEEKSGETTEAKPATQEPVGPRLIIERTDGTRIDRPMSTVRRVVVEANVIVVVLKNGRIERVPMSAVARMAIEP